MPCAQILVDRFCRQRFHGLGLLYQRTDKISLPALVNFASQKSIQPFALGLRHDARSHRRAAGRQFVHDGDIQIAIEDQRQCARDGCSGHDEDIGRIALFAEQRPLAHAKAMLFIRDHQTKILVGYTFCNQSMCADDHIPFALAYGFMRQAMLLGGQAARQQPHAAS